MRFIFIIIFFGSIYSQCSNYSSMECNNSSNCEWIEDISYASCSSLGTSNSSFCDAQPNCSYSWLTYSCGGGTYAVDNSYCEEVEVVQCFEMNELGCDGDDSCNWVEDIETGNCGILVGDDCELNPECNWNCDFVDDYMGWCTYSCDGGPYEIDNSYCEEIEILECSQYNELQCNADSSCNWIDNYYWDNCSNYNSSTSCSTANSNGGNCNWSWNSTLWQDTCSGGSFQADASYCEDVQYLLGDATGDFSINVLDVIQTVNLILNNEYNMTVDMNDDNQLNVLDVILVVDIILGN